MVLDIFFEYKGKHYTGRAIKVVWPNMEPPDSKIAEYFVDGFQPNDLPHKSITFTADKETEALRCNGDNIAASDIPLINTVGEAVKQACDNENVPLFE